jgi:hypothetical protein
MPNPTPQPPATPPTRPLPISPGSIKLLLEAARHSRGMFNPHTTHHAR